MRLLADGETVAHVLSELAQLLGDGETFGHVISELAGLLDRGKERLRIDHHTIADRAGDVWMKDPRRQQSKNDLHVADVDGVTGVMTALIARHDGKVRCQEIDDLALAFISPLRAKYGNVHNGTFYIV